VTCKNALVFALLAGCGESGSVADASVVLDDAATFADASGFDDAAAIADGGVAGPDFRTTLTAQTEFDGLARNGGVKYLLDKPGATPRAPLLEACYFQNTAKFEFHIEFLHSFAELAGVTFRDYEALVLQRPTRIWWGGAVLVTRQRHPISGEPISLAYQVYAENGAVSGLTKEDIVEVDRILKACMPYAVTRLAFVPGDPFQQSLARREADSLRQQGIAVLLP